MCSQTVTFPAIPPNRAGQSLRAKSLEAKKKRTGRMPAVLVFLRDFQHWDTVWQCAVPFLVIAGLLAGAIFLKDKFASSSTGNSAPILQADPAAWKKMADLTKAEQALQAAVRMLNGAHSTLAFEEQAAHRLNTSDLMQKKAAEDRVRAAGNNVIVARRQFETAESKYRELGGTVDYRSQLRSY